MKTGIELIAEERKRQIEVEGWTAEHDDKHKHGELSNAAACYALSGDPRALYVEKIWPWQKKWWKPSGRSIKGQIRDKVKAGALLLADIDRLLRKLYGNNQTAPLKPKIVCLCGSTRFYQEFQKQNYHETMKGNIVLSVGFYPHASEEMHGEKIGITEEQKKELDELHKRKIDLADEIFVLNVGGYTGSSTKSEIQYAQDNNKKIRYLVEEASCNNLT